MRRAVAAGLSAAAVVLAGCGGDGRVAGPVAVAAVPTDLPPMTEPANGGAVELVDSGTSLLVSRDGIESLGFGLLVENTGDMVATNTPIRVDLVDEAGQRLGRERFEVAELLPGHRIGAGATPLSSRLAQGGPVRLDVTIGGSLWYPANPSWGPFPEVDVGAADVDYRPDCDHADASISVESSAPVELRGALSSIVRDGAGDIIGGTGLGPFSDNDLTVPPGSSTHELRLRGTWDCPVPSGSDYDEISVEVYLNPR